MIIWAVETLVDGGDYPDFFTVADAEDDLFATKELAEFWCGILNYQRHAGQLRTFTAIRDEKTRRMDRERVEHVALVAAGLREPREWPKPPEFVPKDHYRVTELEVKGEWPT